MPATTDRTYLVTGGAGYVGSHVARALAEAGHRVVVYDSLERGYRAAVRWGEFVPGDLRDAEKLAATFGAHAFDGVVHLAGFISVEESCRDPRLYMDNNVGSTRCLLDAMVAAGVRHIVFSSSACVYGDPDRVPIGEDHALAPDNPYGETKAISERDISERPGVEGVPLRYFNASGAHPDGTMGEAHQPETHLIPLILRATSERPIQVFGTDYPTRDGTAVRDYVHVWDLARAHVAALDHLAGGGEGQPINLGSGQGFSVLEVIEAVARITGEAPPVVYGDRRVGDVTRLTASHDRATALLGWRPERPLDEIVRDAWRWHRDHPRGYGDH
jgi:UDP-glucose-4-epimerase GalE